MMKHEQISTNEVLYESIQTMPRECFATDSVGRGDAVMNTSRAGCRKEQGRGNDKGSPGAA